MLRNHLRRSAVLIAGLVAGTGVLTGTASAHEFRAVGRYHLVVGFGDEPAFSGGKNSMQLILSTAADKPVVDLGDTLKVAVEKDGQSMPLEIEPNFEVGEFGTPGDYRAWFVPTRPGKYTFHLTGTIKGATIDESFTSSPTGFAEVESPTDKEFPAKDPSTAELGQRLDRELPRLTGALADQSKAARSARDSANRATAVGVVGLVLAAVAVGIAAATVRRRRG